MYDSASYKINPLIAPLHSDCTNDTIVQSKINPCSPIEKALPRPASESLLGVKTDPFFTIVLSFIVRGFSVDSSSDSDTANENKKVATDKIIPFLCCRYCSENVSTEDQGNEDPVLSSNFTSPFVAEDTFHYVIDSTDVGAKVNDQDSLEFLVKNQAKTPRFSGETYEEIGMASLTINEIIGMMGQEQLSGPQKEDNHNITVHCEGKFSVRVHLSASLSFEVRAGENEIETEGSEIEIAKLAFENIGLPLSRLDRSVDSGVDIGELDIVQDRRVSQPEIDQWWESDYEEDDDEEFDDKTVFSFCEELLVASPKSQNTCLKDDVLQSGLVNKNDLDDTRHEFLRANPDMVLLACEESNFLQEQFCHEYRATLGTIALQA